MNAQYLEDLIGGAPLILLWIWELLPAWAAETLKPPKPSCVCCKALMVCFYHHGNANTTLPSTLSTWGWKRGIFASQGCCTVGRLFHLAACLLLQFWKGWPPLLSEYLQGVAMACKELWFGRLRLFCHSLSHKLTNNLSSSASDLSSSTSLHPQPSSYKCLLGLQGSTSSGLPSCDKLDMRESGSATPSCLSSAEHVTLWRLSGLESWDLNLMSHQPKKTCKYSPLHVCYPLCSLLFTRAFQKTWSLRSLKLFYTVTGGVTFIITRCLNSLRLADLGFL